MSDEINAFGWERCSHEGVGKPGCTTCDPIPEHWRRRARVLEEQLAAIKRGWTLPPPEQWSMHIADWSRESLDTKAIWVAPPGWVPRAELDAALALAATRLNIIDVLQAERDEAMGLVPQRMKGTKP